MITPALLDKLHLLRREHCRCGFVGKMPEFHGDACPYKPLAEKEIQAAEQKAPHDGAD